MFKEADLMTLQWTAATLIYMFVPMCGFSSSEQTQNQFSPICQGLTVLFLLDPLIVLLFYASLLICGGFSSHHVLCCCSLFLCALTCSSSFFHFHTFSHYHSPLYHWLFQAEEAEGEYVVYFLSFHHLFILHSDFDFDLITSCQCPTLTTWLWMKIILDPGGCRISGGKHFNLPRRILQDTCSDPRCWCREFHILQFNQTSAVTKSC